MFILYAATEQKKWKNRERQRKKVITERIVKFFIALEAPEFLSIK